MMLAGDEREVEKGEYTLGLAVVARTLLAARGNFNAALLMITGSELRCRIT